jgi:hypothetical protein
MFRLLLLILVGSGLTVLKAQGPPDCGKYPTTTDYDGTVFCHRWGILPWLVGIPGAWETEFRLGVTGDTVRFSFSSSLTFNSYSTNMRVEDSDWGATFFEEIDHINLRKYGSHWIRILGACDYAAGECTNRGATGSMFVNADASNAAALEAVSAFGIYKNTSNGSIVSQATAPVIFLDQAAVRWTAILVETPRAQQSQPGATITSFAVANLSTDSQAVLVRVYDERGNLSASAKTPVLRPVFDSGDVHADTLSNVVGVNLPVAFCKGCADPTVFRGTVVFEGENGGPIAPVVFRFNGPALTTVPVRSE